MPSRNKLQKVVEGSIQTFYGDGPPTEEDVALARLILNDLLKAMGRRTSVVYEVQAVSPYDAKDRRWFHGNPLRTSNPKDVARLLWARQSDYPGDTMEVSELSTYTLDVTEDFNA